MKKESSVRQKRWQVALGFPGSVPISYLLHQGRRPGSRGCTAPKHQEREVQHQHSPR